MPDRSVLDLGDRSQFVLCRRAEAEELQIGRDHLAKHVGAELDQAALGLHRADSTGAIRDSINEGEGLPIDVDAWNDS